jgi:hypothetical protein
LRTEADQTLQPNPIPRGHFREVPSFRTPAAGWLSFAVGHEIMKAKHIALLLLPVSLAVARTDVATGVVLPETVGEWTYADFRMHEPATLGCSYAYNRTSGARGAITFYVYNNGLSDIPTGGDSDVLRREMADVASSISQAWKQRGANVSEEVPATEYRFTDGGSVIAIYSAHKITMNGSESTSISVLTGYRGNFVKVRFTTPGSDLEKARNDLGAFLTALLEANRDSIDPFFISEGRRAQPVAPAQPDSAG